jgi:DNA-binding XRE family transcriptional regulator
MAKRKHIADLRVADLVRERDAREPGFKARVDGRVEQLAIARQVRSLRERSNLTQSELARRAGTGQAAIARIESGRTVPKLDLLARIAVALNAQLRLSLTLKQA